MQRIVFIFWILTTLVVPCADSKSQENGWSNKLEQAVEKKDFVEAIRIADEVVAAQPKSANLYVMRGMVHFQAGDIDRSITDFDRSIELDPRSKPYLWQRGISLYYAGRFKDGAEQFEVHRTVNGNDVENSVWHYLCVARDSSLEEARKKLIPSAGDPRPPMMEVLELYRGAKTVEDVLNAAEQVEGGPRAKPLARFYGNLYVALHYESLGKTELCQKYLEECLKTGTGGYMADVARVHLDRQKKSGTTP
ncbi:MAG: tetratricopeptide repeat protein [Pirellulaceae bacterium]|jgi:lipoprotein NlpI